MTVEAAIYNVILGDEAVQSIIGGRIYPGLLSQGERNPAIVFMQSGEDEGVTTDGAIGMIESRFRLTCWTQNYRQTVELVEYLRTALQDYSGTPISSIKIHHIRIVGHGDSPGLNDKAEQLTRYGKYLDCAISYSET